MTDNRGTLKVVQGAWHLQLNDWYHQTHPLPTHHKEDLCHYFWSNVAAVMYWFFKVGAWWGIAPVFYALVGVIFAFVGYCFWLWPEATIASLLLLLAIVVALTAVVGVIYIGSAYESFDRRAQRIVAVVFAPIWIPLLLLAGIVVGAIEGTKWIDRWWERHFYKSFMSWFFTSHKFFVINPWSVTLTLVLATTTAIFGFESVWEVARLLLVGVAIIAGGIIAAVIIVVIVFLVGSFLKEKFLDWRYQRRQERLAREGTSVVYNSNVFPDSELTPPDKPRGTSSYRVIWQFLVATKHRFCPYIEIVRA